MGNSNVHNHKRCPLFLAGHGGGALKGGLHIEGRRRHADGQRDAHGDAHARVSTTVETLGDSTAAMDLNTATETTVAAQA